MAANRTDEETNVETRKVTKDEAAFILGQGGKTKAKLCVVSGAQIDLAEGRGGDRSQGSQLQIKGTPDQRRYARKYVDFVIAQMLGPVTVQDPSQHDDLTILVVPADTVSFIMGRKGSFLRLVEEEWGALLFFLQVNPKNRPAYVDPNHTERLAIFGPQRRRRGAQLKVMAAIEMKMPGHFTKAVSVCDSPDEGFATDTVAIKEEDYSYALGRSGSTRRRVARASNCIVEYVGRMAYFCGTRQERACGKEYLSWLLLQRAGQDVRVVRQGREDCSTVDVPTKSVGIMYGHKGAALRAVEEETNTFCFLDANFDGEDQEISSLLIFGRPNDRRQAEALVREKFANAGSDGGGGDGYSSHRGPSGDHGTKGWKPKGNGKGGKKGEKGEKGEDFSTKGRGKGRTLHVDGTAGHEPSSASSAAAAGTGVWGPSSGASSKAGAEGEQSVAKGDRAGVSADYLNITEEDASFLMGSTGKIKSKIAAASGASIDMKDNCVEITGTLEERTKAKKYIDLVTAQRMGPVKIDDEEKHADLSIVEVPAEAVSFVTGRQGSFLRLVEEEFGAILFFIDFDKQNRRDQFERLAIFGPQRERRGAELKVMAAIEMKQPGHFTHKDSQLPEVDPVDAFSTDRMVIEEDDYSYALGKSGATRKKIAKASGCVIEYIGRLAYLSGFKKERTRAREYLGWLFRQRVGSVEVDYSNREDVTVIMVPKGCVGFVTGHKGVTLRNVEEVTNTFCFIEGGRDDPHRDPKPLLVFGRSEARIAAEKKLRERIDQKLAEGWVQEDYGGYSGGGHGGSYGEGGGWHWDGSRRSPPRGMGRGVWGDPSTSTGGGGSEPATVATEEAAAEEDEGSWGAWGSSSEGEEAPSAAAPAATSLATGTAAASSAGPTSSEQRSSMQLLGTAGKWNPYTGQANKISASVPGASYPRGGGGLSTSPLRGEELELPPQLLHEEAWPELGDMGAKKKGRK